MAVIYGERIMLREYRADDFSHIRKWVNNQRVVAYLSDIFLYPQSEQQTHQFLDMAMGKDWTGYVIAHKDTGEYIGQIDFVKLDMKNGVGEFGIVIGDEDNHGKGYGSEALRLLIGFGFSQLRLNRVELVCWEHNKKGLRAYEKVGFVREGVRRQRIFRNNQFQDEICFGLLREEWEARKE